MQTNNIPLLTNSVSSSMTIQWLGLLNAYLSIQDLEMNGVAQPHIAKVDVLKALSSMRVSVYII